MNRSTSVRDTVRQIALTVTFSAIGLLIPNLVEELLQLELSKITVAIIAFAFSALGAIIVLPRVFGIPFGKTSFTNLARGIGFYLPKDGWKHIGLGLTLAACTLSGMLVGSILTGEYVVDASNITLSQAVFALAPGIWEEVFFRGMLMVVLLRATRSLKKASSLSAFCSPFVTSRAQASTPLWKCSRPFFSPSGSPTWPTRLDLSSPESHSTISTTPSCSSYRVQNVST